MTTHFKRELYNLSLSECHYAVYGKYNNSNTLEIERYHYTMLSYYCAFYIYSNCIMYIQM